MYVCICNGVTDGQIRDAVACGANSLDDLRDELGVAASCGSCACAAELLLAEGQAKGGACRRACSPRPSSSTLAPAL